MVYDDGIERIPGHKPDEEASGGSYTDRIWNDNGGAMNDAPPFTGEDFYGSSQNQNPFEAGYNEDKQPIDVEGKVIDQDEKKQKTDFDRYASKNTVEKNSKYGGAENLAAYGLDTAARMYGFKNVLKAISETDESDRDAYNPIGSVYSRLVPNPDERRNLYNQIEKNSIVNDVDDDVPEGAFNDKVAIDEEGNFHELPAVEPGTAKDELMQRESNNAIRQMKVLINTLKTDSRFEELRNRAKEEGKDIIDYINSDTNNPTITSFFNGLDAASGGVASDILDAVQKENNKIEAEEKIEEVNEKIEGGQEVTDAEKEEAIQAAEKLKDTSLNEFNGLDPDMLK